VSQHGSHVVQEHPRIGSNRINTIPHMEEIADIIDYQEKFYDGSGFPQDRRSGEDILQGACMLKAALDFDGLEMAGMTKRKAYESLTSRTGKYDTRGLSALGKVCSTELSYEGKSVALTELTEGMMVAEDVKDLDVSRVVSKGQMVS